MIRFCNCSISIFLTYYHNSESVHQHNRKIRPCKFRTYILAPLLKIIILAKQKSSIAKQV